MEQQKPIKYEKALFLYSDDTGAGRVNRHLDEVVRRLKKVFPTLDVCRTASAEEGAEKAASACGVYDTLIFSGGDGTFRNMVSALHGKENAPTLGYINGGTLCDVGKNFGIHGRFRRALKIIEEGFTTGFDIGLANDECFVYMAAVGAYAEIPYVAKRKYKKRLGPISYYAIAVRDAFVPKRVKCRIVTEGKTYDLKTPFILCLNGRYVGGFPVNGRKSRMHDGKFELYLTKPGLFNGLLHYLFFKTRTVKIVASAFDVETSYDLPWCLDGEAGAKGNLRIRCVESGLRVFCARKYAEPLE